LYIKSINIKKIDTINNIKKIDTINTQSDEIKEINFLKSFFPPILLIIVVLGSIIFGIATPSEAAALGVLGAVFISTTQKRITFNIIDVCSKETIKLTSMVFMILIGATFFSLVFRGLEGEVLIHSFLGNNIEDKHMTLGLVLLMMFFLGFILDFIEIIFIIIPLFGPVLFTLGFDPIWVGILIAMVLQTSFLTPPFGFSLFYLRGVAPKNINTIEIYKGVYPFIIIQVLVIGIIFLFPSIATFLPNLISN